MTFGRSKTSSIENGPYLFGGPVACESRPPPRCEVAAVEVEVEGNEHRPRSDSKDDGPVGPKPCTHDYTIPRE